MIEDAKRAWIEANLETGDLIPGPDFTYRTKSSGYMICM
jgi:hypothetical protein